MPPPAFHLLGASHIAVLLLIGLIAAAVIWVRRRGLASAIWLERLLVAALLAGWPLSVYAHHVLGDFSKQNAVPIHLCDVAAYAGVIALLTRARLAAEIAYFFGLAGTLQGLFTPNLHEDFPHPRFIAFFVSHGSVVVAALHVVAGLRLTPRTRAPLRMMGWLLLYAVVVGTINAMLRTNYGFLCQKPQAASLLDVLGPWPWYITSLIGVAMVIFILLDLPFIRRRKLDLSLPSRGG